MFAFALRKGGGTSQWEIATQQVIVSFVTPEHVGLKHAKTSDLGFTLGYCLHFKKSQRVIFKQMGNLMFTGALTDNSLKV